MNSDNIWKVSDNCINCKACSIIAPSIFDCSGDIAIVIQQPKDITQSAQCLEAQTYCKENKSDSILFVSSPMPDFSPTYASEI